MLSYRPSPKYLSILIACLFLIIAISWYIFCLVVPPGNGSVIRDVSFPSGSGIKQLSAELKSNGIIRSSWHFIILSRLTGQVPAPQGW